MIRRQQLNLNQRSNSFFLTFYISVLGKLGQDLLAAKLAIELPHTIGSTGGKVQSRGVPPQTYTNTYLQGLVGALDTNILLHHNILPHPLSRKEGSQLLVDFEHVRSDVRPWCNHDGTKAIHSGHA